MAAARVAGSARDPGACANEAERTRGSITRSQDADLTMLSRDLFTLTRAPRQILSEPPASPWSLARSSTGWRGTTRWLRAGPDSDSPGSQWV
jgi:hypothetical protein